MVRIENDCVGCPKELGCLGKMCPNLNVVTHYCECGEIADYTIDDEDFCEYCAKEYLTQMFDDLTLLEKSEALSVEFIKL